MHWPFLLCAPQNVSLDHTKIQLVPEIGSDE